MTREELKKLSKKEKFLYISYVIFSYGGTLGITLWTFLIEKLIDNNITFAAKVGCGGMFSLVIMFVLGIFFLNKHIEHKLEVNHQEQNQIMKDLLIETNAEKKEEMRNKLVKLENYRVKTVANKSIFKNGLVFGAFVLLLLLATLVENKAIEIRGILFGVVSCLGAGFGFNTAFQKVREKNETKN